MAANGRPRDMPAWMRWVEGRLRDLTGQLRSSRQVPVGAMVRWPEAAAPPDGWLPADGSTFDATEYEELAELLGGPVAPAPAPGTGDTVWIIRAE